MKFLSDSSDTFEDLPPTVGGYLIDGCLSDDEVKEWNHFVEQKFMLGNKNAKMPDTKMVERKKR